MASSSSSFFFSEAVLLACAAGVGVSAFIVLRLVGIASKKEDDNNRANKKAPYSLAATFLQNHRTLTGDDTAAELEARGWSMEESLARAKVDLKNAKARCPHEVLKSLQKGNSRFWTGGASRPELSAFERRALINIQFPAIAVLGCSDSRVPTEIVFDQGLGDMFVVRVAGNCLGMATEASLEYAVHHLHVKVLLVLGHEGCGTIQAARMPIEAINKEAKALSTVLKTIRAGLQDLYLDKVSDRRARDRELVALNVRNQIVKLAEDPKSMEKVNSGELIIVGGFYEMSSGIVDFFMQVSQPNNDDGRGWFAPSPGVQSRYNPVSKEIIV